MARRTAYDSGLTARLESAQRGAAAGVEGSGRAPASAPPGTTVRAASGDEAIDPLLREALSELIDWSRRLDLETDPTRGFGLAQAATLRAQTLSERARLMLTSSPLATRFEGGLADLLAHLAGLMRNALVRMQEFAHELGVESFSVTVASTPPGVSVTFTFGRG